MAITKVTSGLISADASSIDLNIDAGTLYLDVSENRVGIGTTSPDRKLHINESASGTSNFIHLTTADTGTSGSNGFLVGIGSAGNAELWNYEAQPILFATSSTERMRIDSSGTMLVGTSSAIGGAGGTGSQLFLKQSSNSNGISSVANSNDNYIRMLHTGTIGKIETTYGTGSYTPLTLFTGGSERMRIDSSGNVGIGTSSQSGVRLYVDAPDATHASVFTNTQANFAPIVVDNTAASGTRNFISFRINNTEVGKITSTGSSTTYATTSDYRLKENVDYEFNALDRVAQLKPARFNFIADADTTVDGFLAHEVQDIVPEAITGEKDGVREEEYEVTPAVLDDDGNVVTESVMGTREVPEYQGIDQSKLVPLLTKAIQELSDKVDNQQTIIDNLTTRIETLENA